MSAARKSKKPKESELTMVRTSERGKFKRCRQAWHWRYNKGYEARISKPALRFGTLVHESLAAYYLPGRKRGIHPAITFKKLYKQETKEAGHFGMKDLDEEWYDAGELGIDMLENYVDYYGKDGDIEIIAPEHPFKWKMKDQSGKPILYVGRFDAVGRWVRTGEVMLLEHKTASSIRDEHLPLDEQAGAYWAFGNMYLRHIGVLKKGQILDMILYNFLRKSKRDDRPQNEDGIYLNKDGSISKKQPPAYFERVPVYRDEYDSKQVLRRIQMESWEMRMAREGKLPIYKNPTRDCAWDCQFIDMCELHETGGDWKEYAEQMFKQEDPYEEYRKDLLSSNKKGKRK